MERYATCGLEFIDGQCVTGSSLMRRVKHLGPPSHLKIPTWSGLFQTRCGAKAHSGSWWYTEEHYDKWCEPCLIQTGIPYEYVEKV